MTQGKTKEQVLKTYSKANQEYKRVILKKYGVTSKERLEVLLSNKTAEEIKLSKTELSALFINSIGIELTVSFQKQVKENMVLNLLMHTYRNTPPMEVEEGFKQCLSIALRGEERVATGFHSGKLDGFGRVYMTETSVERDLKRASDNRTILVDLKNLNYIIINGVKYTKKD